MSDAQNRGADQSGDPLAAALRHAQDGHAIAVARVIGTWGSAPRPVGSVMTIDASGHIAGSVSGGCVEAEVAATASDILGGAASRVMSFRIGSADAQAAGLACGGELEVLVEPVRPDGLPLDLLGGAIAARQARRPSVLLTRLEAGVPRTTGLLEHDFSDAPDGLDGDVRDAVATGISRRAVDTTGASWFLHVLAPKPRLLIVGGVHIAQALAPLATRVGYEVMVIDPREGLATGERFPDVACSDLWPDEALEAAGIDAETAIVALTHDEKLDDPALAMALRSGAAYVGALGSRRTQRLRLERLAQDGLDEAMLRQLRGPIGLAIGAVGAEEIAISILAEIIAVRRAGPLAQRQGW